MDSEGWTTYQIVIATCSLIASIAALGGVAVALLKWYDKRKTEIYRAAARSAVRSLLFARIELYDTLSLLAPETNAQKIRELLNRQLLHLDKAERDAEDMIPADLREVADLRPPRRVTLDELVVDDGERRL